MKIKGRAYFIRKVHRYLGFVIGIQFVLWTVGGLYFSWTKLDEIHGDHLRAAQAMPDAASAAIAPRDAIRGNVSEGRAVDISKLRLVSVKGEPHYTFAYSDEEGLVHNVLVSASTGQRRGPITEAEALAIASNSVSPAANIRSVELVTKETAGSHHEYREKPLPAWAVTFDHSEAFTAYIGVNDGQVHAVRTDSWRVFDFLWMLHTMDFAGRDNINNYVLRGFSIFGLVTVLSGFVLFFSSSKTVRRFTHRKQPIR